MEKIKNKNYSWILPERSEDKVLRNLNVHRQLILLTKSPPTVLHKDWACTDIDTDQPTGLGRNWARTNIGGVISANSASFPVNLQLNLIENSILMTTGTTYILWHTLLPVFHFPCLVSAASEWREHGKWECDTNTTYLSLIWRHRQGVAVY